MTEPSTADMFDEISRLKKKIADLEAKLKKRANQRTALRRLNKTHAATIAKMHNAYFRNRILQEAYDKLINIRSHGEQA